MAYDKGPSLSGARIEDADFSGARLHAPNFEGAKITDAWFRDADISGDLEGLRLNGIEVGPLVTAELERQSPQRVMLRASDREGLAEAWAMIEETWQETIARARALPPAALGERVDDEWSFLETLRHLVLATDCWLRRMINGADRPYHPWGLAGSWLTDPATWGIDPAASPSLDEILAVRRERMDEVRRTIAALTPEELERVCVPPATPGHPNDPHTVLECLHVILNEEWEHQRYALRDLAVLETALPPDRRSS
jgi:DinB superfamily/Pentapeptide repeats (8 copies)